MLVRYVESLCDLHGIVKSELRLISSKEIYWRTSVKLMFLLKANSQLCFDYVHQTL